MAELNFEQKEKIVLDNLNSIEAIKEKLSRLSFQVENDLPFNEKLFDEYLSDTKSELQKKNDNLENLHKELKEERVFFEKLKEETFRSMDEIATEKSQGFPWLAKAFSDFYYLQNLKMAEYLENKSRPAPEEAKRVRQIAQERRIIEEKLRIALGAIEYYHNLFPFIEEFLGETEEDVLKYILTRNITAPIKDVGEIGVDPVRIYLSAEEYQQLSTTEKNQRALNVYWSRPKNKWQIGRDYERYVGYLHEAKGYSVYYQGILEGFDDLGRDLICKKEDETLIVQCKRWSQYKTIHENHVNQLFGTVVKYRMDNKNEKVLALFYTTTKLSDRAKEFARYLDVNIFEDFQLQLYPCIKCNISSRTGERIYHLPFDQQYDRTVITEERNECYVTTVAEAEELGFRRAFRWHGEGNK